MVVELDRRGVLAAGAAVAGLALAGGAWAASGEAPVAQTSSGQVRGEVEDGVSVFRGIPYGDVTGGGNRFLPPQPLKPWGNVRECRKWGDQCPQNAPPPIKAWASWNVNTGESEDCLALNVWTPACDGAKRPVMVWMHGGGYSEFNGSFLYNDGARLCQRGDVVVVSLNHRLNLFGYLYLAELGGDRFADSGNVGQLDLIAALQWVRDNIASFGGDPGRVMIFGQSGGGGKVSTLLAMPAAKGLFHRAAIQSGPGILARKPDEATETARAVCKAVGVSDKDPGALQHVEVSRLLAALKEVERSQRLGFGPVLDGRNLTHDPFKPGAPPESADVPVIVGYTATETTILWPPPALFSLDWAGLKGALAPQYKGADVDKLIADLRRLRPDASASDLYFIVTSESWMGQGSIELAERKAAQGRAGAYLYRLELTTPVDRLGSPHSLDLPLVFDNVAKSASLLGAGAADAQKVADQMSAAWIAFAHTGSPNATGLASWPRYDARARSTMLFNVESRAVNDPYSEERQLISALPVEREGV